MQPEELTTLTLTIMYFGDVVFAVSGALAAVRHRLDIFGVVLIGSITGIGGGTTRDLLLGRTVWWTENPVELVLVSAAALVTFFFVATDIRRHTWMIWCDTLGLAAFAVVGCNIALDFGSPFIVAVFMGVLTATGGGVIRDVLTQTRPMILQGEPYAMVALAGSLTYATLFQLEMPEGIAEAVALLTGFSLRSAAILFNVRLGPPDQPIRIGGRGGDPT